MTYPLVLAPKGQEIMRINYDASTSVRWQQILQHRYEAMNELNVVVIRLCEVLLAARDNFVETPWAVSDDWYGKWDHYVCHIDVLEKPPPIKQVFFTVSNNDGIIVRINRDGAWTMLWPQVVDAARLPLGSPWAVPLIGFSRVLVAARDRFRTVPWMIACDDDC